MSDVQKSRQKVFDRVVSHLRAQGKKSNGYMGCAYRGDEGAKCAIGIFISNSKYRDHMEGNTVDCTRVFDALPKSVSVTGEQFLSDLQGNLHDDLPELDFLDRMEAAACELATLCDLKYSAPEPTI